MEGISKKGKSGKVDKGEDKERERSMCTCNQGSMEYVKRKREEREGRGELRVEEIFKKSKLTERSPKGKGHIAVMVEKVIEEMR